MVKGSSGVRLETWTGRECKEKMRKLNSAIARNVAGTMNALECTLHWTRPFNFVHVHFAYTQRNFLKTSQRGCSTYVIASGKLSVATVHESDSAPTTGKPQINWVKAKQITVIEKTVLTEWALCYLLLNSISTKQATCTAYTCQRTGKFKCIRYNIDMLSLEIVPNQLL